VGRGWPYRGKTYHCDGWNKLRCTEKDWPWVVVTRISSGAQAALIRRAGAMRIAIRGFVRGLVIDLLDGRIQSFDTVTEVSQMFETDRYHMLEGALEERALKQQLASRRKL
jgi:hypothetical protein